MKKITFLMTIFTTMIFTSCEKEKAPMQLSEFFIGEWVNDDLEELGDDGLLYATFTKNGYTLRFIVNGTPVVIPEAHYLVDNELNQLTIDEPDFGSALKSLSLVLGDDPSQNKFNVEWTEGNNTTMLWKDLVENDYWLKWTRVTD
ncbi:MAG: hypothetical protein J7L04_00030 [Bacteroidales bacterium]|nr:hypothetical protein [Bacteroidales bacterium]